MMLVILHHCNISQVWHTKKLKWFVMWTFLLDHWANKHKLKLLMSQFMSLWKVEYWWNDVIRRQHWVKVQDTFLHTYQVTYLGSWEGRWGGVWLPTKEMYKIESQFKCVIVVTCVNTTQFNTTYCTTYQTVVEASSSSHNSFWIRFSSSSSPVMFCSGDIWKSCTKNKTAVSLSRKPNNSLKRS